LTKAKWDEVPTLFFRFGSFSKDGVVEQARVVRNITDAHRSTSYTVASSAQDQEELWSARKAALWSMLALRQSPTDKVWTTDVAVPLSKLADIIEWTKREIEASGILGSIVGHVADGNFHSLLLFDEKNRHAAEDIVHRMVEKAISMDGTATGEHGVGLVKRDYLESELGKTTVDMMRKVRLAIKCILGDRWRLCLVEKLTEVSNAVKAGAGPAVHS
jgi:D-lactate dehydrogenase (cytochrome)